ncbi:MAG: long-chain fatty acid--CoA ligase [Oscillatoria sp. SIO1A7]|nr:long-chain fatty acid--CoA ligase [Oscillatoria sp. SIO1A7]
MVIESPSAPSVTFLASDRERAYLAKQPDYSAIQSLPEIWPLIRERFGETIALKDPHAKPVVELSYSELADRVQQFAAGVQALGLPPIAEGLPARIALFANDSPRWMIADQGTIVAGAANVVRGADADPEELLYILENSGSIGLVVQNLALAKKLRPKLDDLPIQWVVLLSDEESRSDIEDMEDSFPVPLVSYKELMERGRSHSLQPVSYNRETLATLLYTSGTTGRPKGVMLSHGNLLHQLQTIGAVIQPQQGDSILSILPTWHTFGRTGEYFFLSRGCTQIYSNIRYIKQDFKEFKPLYVFAVPRLWESIYEGVQKQFRQQPESKQRLVRRFLAIGRTYIEARRTLEGLHLSMEKPSFLEKLSAALTVAALRPIQAIADILVYKKVREATGGELKYTISGGGSLAMHLENFFEIVGLEALVGYGLTETSPVLTARRFWNNLRGSAGQPIPGTEIRIVDPTTRQTLPPGERGLVLARGPQIMQGYYQNPEATAKAIDPEGWFNTGDLGLLTDNNDLVLTGRAKDTIVLTNGENIEPLPIEDACARSPYIDQIVLVGQDCKFLGALIVPNLDALEKWANSEEGSSRGYIAPTSGQLIDLESKIVQDLIREELNREVKNRPGYRPDDRIGAFRLIQEPFSIESGTMTQTLKIKRPTVAERYRNLIEEMFA